MNTINNPMEDKNMIMKYLCADCASPNEIKPREPIRCRECGHRIMYKQRTKRSESNSMLVNSFKLPNHAQQLPPIQVSYPTQLTTFSINKDRYILYNNSQLSYYNDARLSIGSDLNFGVEGMVFNENIEHLDNLLLAIDHYKLDWWSYNVITFRGILTKLTTALYNYDDNWCLNCMLIHNSIFISDNSPPAKPSSEWHKRAMYNGYAFEGLATGAPHTPTNNSAQWATINKLRFGKHKILTAGEVDCASTDQSHQQHLYTPHQDDYIELKTSIQIQSPAQQDRFDQKLLKFYFQSYLLGVPKIVVGFKNKSGILVDVKEYDTLSLPNLVRGSNYAWNHKTCTSLAEMLIEFVRETITSIGDESKMYKVFYSAADRTISIQVTHLDDISYPTPDPFPRYGFMPAHLHARMRECVR
ncbi:hypothetical protein E3P86_02722 [Wallemia ichthyophaga]|uniref:Decapping nuclease n=1 Tax=Wallemia ichthyophaga TaxID=245174 RepID=A0A4T0IYP6_WALIC|nr:hypothetical protein E3P86_02722 [Wallemia ichthyophaga]